MVHNHPWQPVTAEAAYLTHTLEALRQQLEADIGFAARYEHRSLSDRLAPQHVGVPPDLARSMDLRLWPQDPGSALEYLAGPAPVGRPLKPIEIVGASAVARGALFRRIERFRAVGDALALSVDLNHDARLVLVFLRWANRPRFSRNDEQTLALAVEPLRQQFPTFPETRAFAVQSSVSGSELNGHQNATAPLADRLSKTEQKVLQYLKQALTEKQIAEEINRSPHTVHVHVKSIYLKLGVSSRRELLSRLNALL